MTTSAPADDSHHHIARKTTEAIFWNYASFGLGKFLTLITTAILARLLTQADFGLIGLATIATEFLGIIKDLGLGEALIQKKDHEKEAADTVFTLNLVLGAALTVLTYLVAPLVALYFQQPDVVPVLRVLGLSFFLNSLGGIHLVLLRRELDFRKKLIPDTARALIKGIVSIVLALLHYGVWALVIGQIVGVLAGVILSWVVHPWRPRFQIVRRLATGLMGFGVSLFFIDMLTVIEDNLDYIIIGRQFGEEMLGVYTLAYRLPEMLVLSLLWVLAKVIFPAYATIQDRPDILRQGFLITLRYLTMFATPICLGLLIAAEPIIRVVFGPNWLEAIPMLRVLAVFALVSSIGFNVGDVYKAVGRTDILIKLSLIYLASLIPALWFGAKWYGPLGVAFGHLAVSVFNMVIRLANASKIVKVNLLDILAELRPSILSGIALTVCVVPALLLTESFVPLAQLAVVVLVGAVSYLGTLWLLEGKALVAAASTVGIPGFKKVAQETAHEQV